MATKKYVSLDKLGLYDGKIKALISTKDAETLDAAKTYANGLATNYDAAGAAATVQGNLDKETARAKAAEEANKALANAAQSDVDALETYVGTIPEGATATNVVAYIQEKTSGIATDTALAELQTQVNTNKKDIADVKADYLKSTDKTELSDAIGAEKTRAEGIEDGLRTDVNAIKADYLKASDKTALEASIAAAKKAGDDAQADIDAFMAAADVGASAVDTLKEIQDYITSDGKAAATMTNNIAANASAIEALGTKVGNIPEGATSSNIVGYVQEVVGAEQVRAEGVESGLDSRLDVIEAKFGSGDGSVADMIADAKAGAISEATTTAAADATTKANKAETNAKAHADGLNTAMNTRVEALEAIKHEHANKALLDTYTQTEANLADAVAKKHEHTNKTVLDGITAEKVTAWDKVSEKANQTALQAEIERATAAEAALGARIDEFVEVSEAEINALFATA